MFAHRNSEDRSAPRGLVHASALVIADGRPTTHHMVYDLSVRGIRLCGLPGAELGNAVEVVLCLPRERATASGRLVRAVSTGDRSDFAVAFDRISASSEDDIHDAVLEALSHDERDRSVLLFRDERHFPPPDWAWLRPILPMCAMATLASLAVEHLETHPIEFGILSAAEKRPCLPHWAEAYPEIRWQSVDERGCLTALADPLS